MPFSPCVYVIGQVYVIQSCVYVIGQVYVIQSLCLYDRPSLCHSVLVFM